jgi:hypothetical protein
MYVPGTRLIITGDWHAGLNAKIYWGEGEYTNLWFLTHLGNILIIVK